MFAPVSIQDSLTARVAPSNNYFNQPILINTQQNSNNRLQQIVPSLHRSNKSAMSQKILDPFPKKTLLNTSSNPTPVYNRLDFGGIRSRRQYVETTVQSIKKKYNFQSRQNLKEHKDRTMERLGQPSPSTPLKISNNNSQVATGLSQFSITQFSEKSNLKQRVTPITTGRYIAETMPFANQIPQTVSRQSFQAQTILNRLSIQKKQIHGNIQPTPQKRESLGKPKNELGVVRTANTNSQIQSILTHRSSSSCSYSTFRESSPTRTDQAARNCMGGKLQPKGVQEMKNRNREWLENLDRVQNRIKSVLQR